MKMVIAGKPVDSKDGATIDVMDPDTGKRVDTVPSATEADVKRCVASAKRAQKKWAQVPVHKRAEIMNKFVDLVERDKAKLARTLMRETGKPITEAKAEIANIPIAFKAFSERAKHLYGEIIYGQQETGQEAHTLLVKREPIGVVAAVIPFNFPGVAGGQFGYREAVYGQSADVVHADPVALRSGCHAGCGELHHRSWQQGGSLAHFQPRCRCRHADGVDRSRNRNGQGGLRPSGAFGAGAGR